MIEYILMILLGTYKPTPPKIIPLVDPVVVQVDIYDEIWGDVSDDAKRIIECESGGNPDAHNLGSDSRGLMQIHYPTWHKIFGDVDYYDIETNLRMGKYIYSQTGDFSQWSCRYVLDG